MKKGFSTNLLKTLRVPLFCLILFTTNTQNNTTTSRKVEKWLLLFILPRFVYLNYNVVCLFLFVLQGNTPQQLALKASDCELAKFLQSKRLCVQYFMFFFSGCPLYVVCVCTVNCFSTFLRVVVYQLPV